MREETDDVIFYVIRSTVRLCGQVSDLQTLPMFLRELLLDWNNHGDIEKNMAMLRRHRVSLVWTHRKMVMLTLKGQGQSLA